MLDEKFRKEPSLDERVKAYFIKGLSQQKKKNIWFYEPNNNKSGILQEQGPGWKGA